MIDKYFPKKTKIELHDTKSWLNFIQLSKIPTEVESCYLPRNLTAHLQKDVPFFEINKFHEYYGHGSFCEYSFIGKKIVKFEHDLVKIEKLVLGVDKLPEMVHFKLDLKNPHYNDYKEVRENFDKYLFVHHKHFEGFAYWLEKKLAFSSGLEENYLEREKFIKPFYLQLVDAFEKFVKKNSVSSLYELMQFE